MSASFIRRDQIDSLVTSEIEAAMKLAEKNTQALNAMIDVLSADRPMVKLRLREILPEYEGLVRCAKCDSMWLRSEAIEWGIRIAADVVTGGQPISCPNCSDDV